MAGATWGSTTWASTTWAGYTVPVPPTPPVPGPPNPNYQQFDGHTITYKVTDLGNNGFEVIAELPFTQVTYTTILNGIGQFQGTLNVEDPRVRSLDWIAGTIPWQSAVWVDIDGDLQFGGPIVDQHYTMSTGTVTVRAIDFYGYMSQILPAFDYSENWATSPASAGDIAYTVMTDALSQQYAVPIGVTKAAEAPSEYWITATFPSTQAQTVNSIVTQLQQLAYTVGIDYVCVPQYVNGTPIPGIVLYYPRAGAPQGSTGFVIDVSQALEFEYDMSGTNQSNAVIEMASASGSATVGYAWEPALVAGWPLLEQVISHAAFSPIAESPEVLLAFANSDLAIYTYPITAPTVTLPLFGKSLPIGSFGMGDDVTLYIPVDSYLPSNPRFPSGLNYDFRIVRCDVTIADEGLSTMELTLNIPPDTQPNEPPTDTGSGGGSSGSAPVSLSAPVITV